MGSPRERSVSLATDHVWRPHLRELEDGLLIAFETGDPKDDGWPMWGGGPGHNGLESPLGAQAVQIEEEG